MNYCAGIRKDGKRCMRPAWGKLWGTLTVWYCGWHKDQAARTSEGGKD